MLVMGAGLGFYAIASLAELQRSRVAPLAVSGAIEIAYYSVRVANAWL